MRRHQWKKAERTVLASVLSLTLLFSSCLAIPAKARAEEGGTEASDSAVLHNPRVVMNECDTVYFGRYWQEDTNGDGVADQNDEMTPIRWRILSRNGDDAYVIADQVLDAKPYNEKYTNVTWETCTLRTWLNEEFYNNAFTSEEQETVIEQTLVKKDNEVHDTEGGNDTTDKVYLASIADMENADYGFQSDIDFYDQARIGTATAYARSQGAYANGEMGSWWWLRSPVNDPWYTSYVYDNGCVLIYGSNVGDASGGVRPALHLNLSSPLVHSAEKQEISVKSVSWDTVEFGSFDGEPIVWRVLEVSDGTAYLLADRILTEKTYNDENERITWEDCKLRKWLNGTFYEDSFTQEEKNGILLYTYENADNVWYDTEGGEDTQDRITLLSLSDTVRKEYGFPTYYMCGHSARIACGKNGLDEYGLAEYGWGNWWWLRSPGDYANIASYVDGHGNVDAYGEIVGRGSRGVRPALHISLSSSLVKTGTVTADETGIRYNEEQDETTTEAATTTEKEPETQATTEKETKPGTTEKEVDTSISPKSILTIEQAANDLEGCTIALSGTLVLDKSVEASQTNLQAAIDSLEFVSSDDSKAKVLYCNAVQSEDYRSAELEIWTTLYNTGEAAITAKTSDGQTAECRVTIQENPSEENKNYEGDYTGEMRDFLTNRSTIDTMKYLCTSANFPASTFVAENDAKFGNLLAMAITDTYYRGWDGWRDLMDGSTSVEDADKIIASLLDAYQVEVEGLSKAKTAQKYAKMMNDAFGDYSKSTKMLDSLNSEEIQVVRQYFSEDNLARLLFEGKYDEIASPVNQILQQSGMNQIMQKSEVFKAGTEASKAWNKKMEGFTQSAEMSNIAKKGCQTKLGGLEIGGGLKDIGYSLKLVSFSQDTINYLYQLDSLLNADEMYCEMLLYVQENCPYSVVQEAAGNLYSVISDGMAGITADVAVKIMNKVGEKVIDKALDAACDASLPFAIIKAGFDWGVSLSNLFFKTEKTQVLKDSLRSQAFLANTIGRWAISKEIEYMAAIGTEEESLRAKEFYYSLYMVWEARKCAEETLQKYIRKVPSAGLKKRGNQPYL